MPSIVIPAVIGGLVSSAITGIAGAVFGGIVAGGISRAMAPRDTFRDPGLTENAGGAVEQLPVIYGRRRISGIRVAGPWVKDGVILAQEFLHQVWAICEGEVSAINTVYLDDVASSDTRFSGLVTLEKYTGTDTQAASAALISDFPTKWTAAHQGKGVAYVYSKLQWREGVFNGFPVFNFDVDGKKVWDPRLGSPTVTAWSDNPALCVLDYLMNDRYGWDVDLSRIDVSTFEAAADFCDDLVTVPATGSPSLTQQKRYRCDGVLFPDAGRVENMKALLSSCRGNLVLSGGRYRLVLDRVTTASDFEFNEENIVGGWQFRKAGKAGRLNRVRARFFNPSRRWQEDFAIWDDSTDRAADGGLLLESEISLPFTKNAYNARQLALLEQRLSRDDLVAEFTAAIEGMRCEVGDVVPIRHSTPGWSGKLFRVTRIELLNTDEVTVTVREYNESSYSLDELDVAGEEDDTDLPDPFTVAAPDGLTFIQHPTVWDTAILSWTNNDVFGVQFQAEFKLATDSTWTVVPLTKDATIEIPKLRARRYDFRVKAINQIGVSSDYATASGTMTGPSMNFNSGLSGSGILKLINTVSVGDDPVHLAWAPAQDLVYVLCRGSQRIDVINPRTDEVVNQISLAESPSRDRLSIHLCPTNGRLYVQERNNSFTQDARLSVVDPATNEVTDINFGSPGIASNCFPNQDTCAGGFYCPVDNCMYFVRNGGAGNGLLTLLVINPDNSVAAEVSHGSIAGFPGGGLYCPSNGMIYAGCGNDIGIFDPVTRQFVGSILNVGLGGSVSNMTYCPTSDRIYVITLDGSISVVDPYTNEVVATLATASPSYRATDIAHCPLSDLIYFSTDQINEGAIRAIRPDTHEIATAREFTDDVDRLLWVPSVAKMYACNRSADTVLSFSV